MFLKETFDKLDSAVQSLICTDMPLRNRLDTAIVSVVQLSEKDLPPDCRKEFNLLLERIKHYHASGERLELQPALALAIYGLLKNFISLTSGGFGFVTM